MAWSGELRAADTDRQATADRLRAAVVEGRLDLDEYDRRLGSAYAATSYADLDRLTADLPAPAPPPPPALVPAVASVPAAAARRVAWIAGCPPAGCLVLVVLLIVAMLAGD